MIITIFLLFVLFFYCVLITIYRIGWDKISVNEIDLLNTFCKTTISVIVPARNEEQYIVRCIQSLLDQTYQSDLFEIIIVDDCSTDDTLSIAKSFLQSNVKAISLNDIDYGKVINSYKKKAIETGITLAKGELIVCTDADCIAPVTWLQSLAAFYEKNEC